MQESLFFHFNSKRELKSVTKDAELKPTPGIKYLVEYGDYFEGMYYYNNRKQKYSGQRYWAMFSGIPEEYKEEMRKAIGAYLILVN